MIAYLKALFLWAFALSRPSAPQRPAVLGILTPKKDPYMEYGISEVNKIVTVDDAPAPMPDVGRSPSLFVEEVTRVLNKREICMMYMEGSIGPSNPKKVWPEMRIAAWREKVMIMLPNGRFSPPDDLDSWTFVHYPLAHPVAFDRYLMTRYPMIAGCYIQPEEIDEWKRLNPEYVTKIFNEWNAGRPTLVANHSRR